MAYSAFHTTQKKRVMQLIAKAIHAFIIAALLAVFCTGALLLGFKHDVDCMKTVSASRIVWNRIDGAETYPLQNLSKGQLVCIALRLREGDLYFHIDDGVFHAVPFYRNPLDKQKCFFFVKDDGTYTLCFDGMAYGLELFIWTGER